jgi:hypothetical protein
VQGALVTSGLVAVVALPEIYGRGKAARQLELLRQNDAANLGLIVLAVVTAACYLLRVRRDARTRRDHNDTSA